MTIFEKASNKLIRDNELENTLQKLDYLIKSQYTIICKSKKYSQFDEKNLEVLLRKFELHKSIVINYPNSGNICEIGLDEYYYLYLLYIQGFIKYKKYHFLNVALKIFEQKLSIQASYTNFNNYCIERLRNDIK
jgi:hypothetical protein